MCIETRTHGVRSSSGATHPGMANTYSQIYVQVVFAVEARQAIIREERREKLQRYMTGIVTNQNQKLLAIYCMPDHTHLLIGLKPSMLFRTW